VQKIFFRVRERLFRLRSRLCSRFCVSAGRLLAHGLWCVSAWFVVRFKGRKTVRKKKEIVA
jgi:hypothetical protein